ncbi:hypothetical protein [Marinomonas sp. 2405UD68-3]|uniref:hypothetical protein n=1 Tax=Marinomonas sp. 2405UD68-3 TaxID=3391835 RepID=UPI0039C91487
MAQPIKAQLNIERLSPKDKELVLAMPESEVKQIFKTDKKNAESFGPIAHLLTGKSTVKPYFGMSREKKRITTL